jgi:sortase (surface protein transpeptidase)
VPVRLVIPAIGVDAPVVGEGLDAQGALEAPPLAEHNLTGWYHGGPSPGEFGPAVIEGHVDSKAGPSVFYNLGRLTQGTQVQVIRADGRRAVFQVDSLEQVSKNAFPTRKVYGPLPYSGLRLITCGGTFNQSRGSYTDNIIVYAHRIT